MFTHIPVSSSNSLLMISTERMSGRKGDGYLRQLARAQISHGCLWQAIGGGGIKTCTPKLRIWNAHSMYIHATHYLCCLNRLEIVYLKE